MKKTTVSTLILFLIIGIISFNVNAQTPPKTMYVDASNTNTTLDGLSWATAYISLDDAIYDNNLNPSDTIFIAEGTYSPGIQGNAFYIVVPLLHIYGGFPEGGGTLDQRDWENDSTILKPNGGNVLYISQSYMPEVDGLYITEGSNVWGGGGIYNSAYGATFRNLVIYNNSAQLGGGLLNDGEEVILDNIIFKNDTASYQNGWGNGGALYNNGDNVTLTNIIFQHNYAEGTNGSGAGAFMNYGDNLIIEDVDFIENRTYNEDNYVSGGALDNSGDNITLKNVNFTGNSIGSDNENVSGGAFNQQGEGGIFENVTFSQNKAESTNRGAAGGGMTITYNNGGDYTFKNITFSKNEAIGTEHNTGGGLDVQGGGKITMRDINFSQNKATGIQEAKGGGMRISCDTLDIANTTFFQNKALSEEVKSEAGGMDYNGKIANSLFIGKNLSFIENESNCILGKGSSGGATIGDPGKAEISSCVFKDNSISGSSGINTAGALMLASNESVVSNSVFYGNKNTANGSANSYGGAIVNTGSQVTFNNLTMVNNQATATGNDGLGGAIISAGNMTINNTIFWNNTASSAGDDINSLATMTVNSSYTQSDFTAEGVNNIQGTTDPFLDVNNPDGTDGTMGTADDGLALTCQAIPIDAGDNSYLNSEDTLDIVQLKRINGTVDMGAYEYHGLVDNIENGEVCVEAPYVWNATIYTEPGSYSNVSSTDGNGCDIIDVLTLVQKPDAIVNFLTRPPRICIDTYFSTAVYSTQDITGISSVSGLPDGVTATYANDTITLSGTPTEDGFFQYSINPTGCGDTEVQNVMMVVPDYTIEAASITPNVCIYTEMDTIIHKTSHVELIGNIVGLPDGVTASYYADTIRVLGTPTEFGTFNYEIEVYGKCGYTTATGTINVSENTINNNNIETITCLNQAMVNVEFDAPQIDTIKTSENLPDGITAEYLNDKIILSGTPTENGLFEYTITGKGGCGVALGEITVSEDMEVQMANLEPQLCIDNEMDSIIHLTTNVSGIGNISNLPNGVSVSFENDTLLIVGTPTESGVFNYTIELDGDCGQASATGVISVMPEPTISSSSTSPELCVNTMMDEIIHESIEVTGIQNIDNLPDGVNAVFQDDTLSIYGTPTEAGTFEYAITLEGTCGTIDAIGTITVTPDDVISTPIFNSDLCINNPVVNIIHTTSGVLGINQMEGLPTGVSASYEDDTITISGTATETGSFDYTITPEGTCGNNLGTGTINIFELPTVDLGDDITFCADEDFDIELDAENNGSIYQWNTGETTQTINVNEFGNYSVSVTDLNGCTNVSGVTILSQPLPITDIQVSEDNVLTSVVGNATYQWIKCPNETISGANQQFYKPTENGSYALIITSSFGCTDTSMCVEISTIGLENNEMTNMSVYPNPTDKNITVDFGQVFENVELKLTNVTGKTISKTTSNGKSSLILQLNGTKGIYFLYVKSQNGSSRVFKILKN